MQRFKHCRDLVMREREDGNYVLYADAQAEIARLTRENERLLGLVSSAESIFINCHTSAGVCCCGDNMDGHSDPMACGHSPVDMGEYSASQWLAALQRKAGE